MFDQLVFLNIFLNSINVNMNLIVSFSVIYKLIEVD